MHAERRVPAGRGDPCRAVASFWVARERGEQPFQLAARGRLILKVWCDLRQDHADLASGHKGLGCCTEVIQVDGHDGCLPAGNSLCAFGSTTMNRKHTGTMLTINEIFYSVQGESSHMGRPCVFVRLTACDLRCSWCDTSYAFDDGQKRSVDEVIETVDRYGCELVEITGGEPLLQADVYPLMESLLASGKTVLLETGGHIDISRVPPAVVKVVDVKCPGSGEAGRNEWRNLDRLAPHDEIKFVINDRADYEFARDVVRRHSLKRKNVVVLFSPVHRVLESAQLAAWVLHDRLSVRVQVQLHKYLWGDDARGV